jgi:Nitrile hydratase, alpha chain
MAGQQDWQQAWGEMVAQAWSDDGYKQRLVGDPASALGERGLTPPAGKEIRVLEDTSDTVHIVLPARPGELSDEELDQAAGGAAVPRPCASYCQI